MLRIGALLFLPFPPLSFTCLPNSKFQISRRRLEGGADRTDTVRDGTAIYTTLEITFVFKGHPEPVVIPILSYFERIPKGEEEQGKIKTLMIYEDLAPIKAVLGH